jgi:hypothetical protein
VKWPKNERAIKAFYDTFMTRTAIYVVRPRKDHRGVDLISDALPFGRLWYGEPNNAVDYAKHRSRSHDAVIRVYDEAGKVIEAHGARNLFHVNNPTFQRHRGQCHRGENMSSFEDDDDVSGGRLWRLSLASGQAL